MRHPVLGCNCSEGRITKGAGYSAVFMPPVHDCEYIKVRNQVCEEVLLQFGPRPRGTEAAKEWQQNFNETVAYRTHRALKETA